MQLWSIIPDNDGTINGNTWYWSYNTKLNIVVEINIGDWIIKAYCKEFIIPNDVQQYLHSYEEKQ